MNVNKRLSKLESQLIGSDDIDSNVIMIEFVRPGQLDARITHIWSIAGTDDCYLEDGESDEKFMARAAKDISEFNNIDAKQVLLVYGDTEIQQIAV